MVKGKSPACTSSMKRKESEPTSRVLNVMDVSINFAPFFLLLQFPFISMIHKVSLLYGSDDKALAGKCRSFKVARF